MENWKSHIRNLITLSLILIFLTGCVSVAPKMNVNLQNIPESDLKIVEKGKFHHPYKKVFNSAIKTLESQDWSVINLKRDDGIIKTATKTNYFVGADYGIICRVIKFDKNDIQVKWFYTAKSTSVLDPTQVNIGDAMSDDLQKKWNYLLLETIKSDNINSSVKNNYKKFDF